MSKACFFNIEDIRLPKGFADELLDLEMKMDFDDFTFDALKRLNDLYKTAVEYYIVINQKKALFFQKKISNLLSQPQTQQLMDIQLQQGTLKRAKSQLPQQMRHQLNKFNYQADSCVKNMIENGKRRIANSQTLIQEDIGNQEKKIKQRMLNRVKSREKV